MSSSERKTTMAKPGIPNEEPGRRGQPLKIPIPERESVHIPDSETPRKPVKTKEPVPA